MRNPAPEVASSTSVKPEAPSRRALVGDRVSCCPFANEAEAAVDRDMILIPEDRDHQIERWR